MGMQLWLAKVLRDAGLPVVEVSGWSTRSADEDEDASTFHPEGLIIHETRGSATSTDAGEIAVLINGRVGLSGPIAQLYLSRTGTWHVVAAGLCHHVKTGWGGPFEGLGNSRLLGIEAQHAESESWALKPQQYQSYVRGAAAIVKALGWPLPVGHKEHQPGDKPDPEFSMATFRTDVARVIATGGSTMAPADEQALIWRVHAMFYGLDKVAGGPHVGKPEGDVKMWDKIAAEVLAILPAPPPSGDVTAPSHEQIVAAAKEALSGATMSAALSGSVSGPVTGTINPAA